MQLLNDLLGRHADGADEETGALVDDDIDELVELAAGVVIVGLSRAAADLRKQNCARYVR